MQKFSSTASSTASVISSTISSAASSAAASSDEPQAAKETAAAIIIIEKNYISILTMSCYATDIDEFRQWRSDMLGVFGGPNSMVIEIGCDGPIEWTKNAPDPKDMKWRR